MYTYTYISGEGETECAVVGGMANVARCRDVGMVLMYSKSVDVNDLGLRVTAGPLFAWTGPLILLVPTVFPPGPCFSEDTLFTSLCATWLPMATNLL